MITTVSGKTRLDQKGFTLVEVLIAVSLMAIMFIVVFNVLHFAARAWDKGVARVEVANRVYLVQDLLRNAFLQAQPIVLRSGDGKKRLAFNGEEKDLRFVAPLSAAQKSGGLYVVELEHVQQEAGGMLVMHYHRYHHSDDSFDTMASNDLELLLENVENISFRYFGPDYEQGVTQWSPQWKEQSVLPYKIEMHVKFSRQDLVWPVLIVDPKMTERQMLSQAKQPKAG